MRWEVPTMCERCEQNHQPDPLVNYLSELLPHAPSGVVEDVLNMSFMELFIRTPKGQWDDIFSAFKNNYEEILDENNHPEVMDGVFAERDRQQAKLIADSTESDMTEDLNDILNTQGVLDDDEVYGNYL